MEQYLLLLPHPWRFPHIIFQGTIFPHVLPPPPPTWSPQVCNVIPSLSTAVFAVTPFLGDITPFSKPGRRFGNYVASLGRSFTVVNIVGSRPAFRVSSIVIRSVFTNGLSIQTWSPMLSSRHHVQPYDTLGAATVTIPQASSITYLYALIIRARTVALHGRINHNCYQLPA